MQSTSSSALASYRLRPNARHCMHITLRRRPPPPLPDTTGSRHTPDTIYVRSQLLQLHMSHVPWSASLRVRYVGNTQKTLVIPAKQLNRPSRRQTRVGPRNHVLNGAAVDAHWRHLRNTTERSVRGDDAALRQINWAITLPTAEYRATSQIPNKPYHPVTSVWKLDSRQLNSSDNCQH